MKNTELPFIKDMFDTIAPKYDFLNRTLSMKRDVYWRQQTISSLNLSKNNTRLLDVACGTGDISIEAVKQYGKLIDVTGVDFSEQMLFLGKEKINKANIDNISFMAGNALELPFENNYFDAVTIAFGIRNIADKQRALKEFLRCLKKGGSLAVLELSTPEDRFFNVLYMFYFKKVLPFVGGLFSKNLSAYQYLPESVVNFPDSKTFGDIMKSSGFLEVTWKKMTLGIVTLYVGKKSAE